MKYTYTTATGKIEIEVDEHLHKLLTTLDTDESNSNRKHSRRHPISLGNTRYEGKWLSDETDLLGDLIRTGDVELLKAAMSQLPIDQQTLIREVYFEDMPPSIIAKREGVDKSAISHRLDRIYKKMKKILL